MNLHHFATLFGFGASAINPYLVNEIICEQIRGNDITELTVDEAVENFNKAIGKGILKVMNKIGISTLHSYRGSQFLNVGINTKVVDKYFPKYAYKNSGYRSV